MKYLAGPVIALVTCLGCGGKTGVGSPGTGGRGGEPWDAGRDSAGGSAADASSSGGARGGVGGGATGGAAGGGKGGAGGAKGGAGGALGGVGGGAAGGAGSGRCTVFQFPASQPSMEQILVDMDGDGRLDVVSTWSDITGLHVLTHRQTAPRVFADPVQYDDSIGIFTQQGMAAADLDQDGIPDVAMADFYGDVVVMLSGGGTGYSFPPHLMQALSQTLEDLVLADFDADGYVDIAVPIYESGVSHGFYWGTGKGAFAARASAKVCSSGTATAVIDANEDGRPDLVVVCYSGGAQVLLNQGGRSFTPVLLPGASQSFALATGDLNNDGHVDVVVPDRILHELVVSLGDGHGGFTVVPGGVSTTTSDILTAAMGDLDGDGNADVVVSDGNVTTLAFYQGMGDGHFQAPQNLSMATSSGYHPIIRDVDGDGTADLLISHGPTIVYGPCP